jgi:hypothetical protein
MIRCRATNSDDDGSYEGGGGLMSTKTKKRAMKIALGLVLGGLPGMV